MASENKETAAFCLLARDCENNLRGNIPFIERYRGQFRRSVVIVIENDSKDGTKELLERWGRESEEVIVQTDYHPEWDKRSGATGVAASTPRIASCRNEYLRILRERSESFDYLITVDMDVELLDVDLIRIIHEAPSDFSALFANGRYYLPMFGRRIPTFYYDLYAYVPNGSPSDLNGSELCENGYILDKRLRRERYVPCDSAFGGLAVYRAEAVKDLEYTVIPNTRSKQFPVLCEHVPFNKECGNNGALYVARELRLFYEAISLKDLFLRLSRRILGEDRYRSIMSFYYTAIRGIKDDDTPKD